MSLSQDAQTEAELARAKITTAKNMDDDYKKNLLELVSISTLATNGISPEEKIQKMTEAIRKLALTQVDFLTSIQDTIINAIQTANTKQCQDCLAMKHAKDVKQKEEQQRLIEEWKLANGIKDIDLKDQNNEEPTWTQVLKNAISHPGMWIFLIFVVISPYGVDILKAVLEFFNK